MDKDRVEGAAKQAKGTVKEAVGELTGDAKLKADGKKDKAEGKVQNASAASRTASGMPFAKPSRPGFDLMAGRYDGRGKLGVSSTCRGPLGAWK